MVKGIKDNGERDLGKCASLLAGSGVLSYCTTAVLRLLDYRLNIMDSDDHQHNLSLIDRWCRKEMVRGN